MALLVIAYSTPHTRAAGLGLTRPVCVSVTRSPCQLSASDFQMPTTISGMLSKLLNSRWVIFDD